MVSLHRDSRQMRTFPLGVANNRDHALVGAIVIQRIESVCRGTGIHVAGMGVDI